MTPLPLYLDTKPNSLVCFILQLIYLRQASSRCVYRARFIEYIREMFFFLKIRTLVSPAKIGVSRLNYIAFARVTAAPPNVMADVTLHIVAYHIFFNNKTNTRERERTMYELRQKIYARAKKTSSNISLLKIFSHLSKNFA